MSTLWHGRFEGGPADELLAFTVSLPFDQRLAADDIAGLAGPRARAWSGPGSSTTTRRTRSSPRSTRSRTSWPTARFAFVPTDEDIHTAVERRVTELAGPAGAKLHTGRSRNDQVATDLRLYAQAGAGRRWPAGCSRCSSVLLDRADDAGDAYLPGYTHLQRAQPVLLAHHLLAHGWALARDVDRLLDARRPRSTCRRSAPARWPARRCRSTPTASPPTSASPAAFENSLDAVQRPRLRGRGAVRPRPARRAPVAASARRSCCGRPRSSASSRSTTPTPPAARCCPQKKNPDIAELARGKAGRLIGHLTGLLATLKGLPLAYNRDLQEDKEPLFDAVDQVAPRPSRAMAGLLATVDVRHRRACRRPPTRPYAAATDLAELLVERGMPFRDAHAIVGGARARVASSGGVPLAELVAAARRRSGRTRRALLEPGRRR